MSVTGIFFHYQDGNRLRDFPEALEGILSRDNVLFYDAFYPLKPPSSFDIEPIPIEDVLAVHSRDMVERVRRSAAFEGALLSASGTVAGWIAFSTTNNTGGDLSSFTAFYDGEQWRNGGNNPGVTQKMTVEYGYGSTFANVTTWNSTTSLFDFVSPTFTTTAGALLMIPCSVPVSVMTRAINSPVLVRLKKAAGMFIICANKRRRRSVMARMDTHCSR